MSQMELEIYKVLEEIDVLDAKIYCNLIRNYDEQTVNNIIEKMMDTDIRYVSKFDYYITKVAYCDNVVAKDIFDAYLLDLNSISVFSKDENSKLAKEIFLLVNEIKEILDKDNSDGRKYFWIGDKVDTYLNECRNSEDLIRLKKLYDKFIYKRNVLLEGNLKFVIFVGKQYFKKGVESSEIVQYGNVGLMKACEKYNPSFNASFTTYAYYWIKQCIMKGLADITTSVTVSYGMVTFNMLMKKTINMLSVVLNREPTEEEIAEYMEVSVDKIRTCLQVFSDPFSLNEPLNSSSDDEGDSVFMDSLEDKRTDVFDIVSKSYLSNDLMDFLVKNLTDKEFAVICSRFELNDNTFKTLDKVGIEFGVTRERIRQIENKAINKIRKKGRYLADYLS